MTTSVTPNQYTEAAYREVCTSYRSIDDFRQKLLAALPLVSGAGIFLLSGDLGKLDASMLMPIGFFGFVVTLGLLIFEIHGIRRCTHLIVLGKYLEKQMEIEGQFINRCDGLQSINGQKGITRFFNEPLAAGVIYPAVLAGWIFLALRFTFPHYVSLISFAVFIIGFVAMPKFNIWLIDKDSKEKLEKLEKS